MALLIMRELTISRGSNSVCFRQEKLKVTNLVNHVISPAVNVHISISMKH